MQVKELIAILSIQCSDLMGMQSVAEQALNWATEVFNHVAQIASSAGFCCFTIPGTQQKKAFGRLTLQYQLKFL